MSGRLNAGALSLLALAVASLAWSLVLLSRQNHASALYWVVAGGLALDAARSTEERRAPS